MTVHLQNEIEQLKKKILALSAHVDTTIDKAVRSLKDRDESLSKQIIEGDGQIDQLEVDLEEDCLKVLALYQPVAGDLRYVIAILKINNELERIADQAVNIAERARDLVCFEAFNFPNELLKMVDKAQYMLKKTLKALIDRDSKAAREVIKDDREVDDLNRIVHDLLLEKVVKKPEMANCWIMMISTAKHLERIADQVTNIAEDIIYLVEGKIVRHEL